MQCNILRDIFGEYKKKVLTHWWFLGKIYIAGMKMQWFLKTNVEFNPLVIGEASSEPLLWEPNSAKENA